MMNPPEDEHDQMDDMWIDHDGNMATPSDDFWEQFREQSLEEDEHGEVEGKGQESGQEGNNDDLERVAQVKDDRRHKPPIPGTRTEWHPHGGKTFGKGRNIFEVIWDDRTERGDRRRENFYYPFRDKVDYGLGRWLSNSDLPMTQIDQFLKLAFVSTLRSFFRLL